MTSWPNVFDVVFDLLFQVMSIEENVGSELNSIQRK